MKTVAAKATELVRSRIFPFITLFLIIEWGIYVKKSIGKDVSVRVDRIILEAI